ncbi:MULTISPECIES: beta-lactamase regulator AmpE [Ferrimonas]|uniref:beta-lactamase regulator AmpE n=1 Tax=Ferrimonas TaxID=44011 RepID=UPI0004009CA7|nr:MULTISPECIES: beta-lactamase regulator AmpE [Ferrimonas]USD37189.1 beta-lactamase regulator AmpE [Ferrimonas sp. SCSIO 43195]
MALFSLLVVLILERLKLIAPMLQFNVVFGAYQRAVFNDVQLRSWWRMALVLVLPAALVALLAYEVQGSAYGLWHLGLWLLVGVVLFGHSELRERFKEYLQAACRGDVQACFHTADRVDVVPMEAVSEKELGQRMGQVAAWLNYRYYAAVALYFVLLGPAVATLYCTVRAYHDHFERAQLHRPLVKPLLALMDWLPARIVAFGFALTGHFSRALSVWMSLAFRPTVSARELITEVALVAEEIPLETAAPVCVQSTLSLLKLAKRNVTLLLIVVSLLTIFGFIH